MREFFQGCYTTFFAVILLMIAGCAHAVSIEVSKPLAEWLVERLTEEKLGVSANLIEMDSNLVRRIAGNKLDDRLLETGPAIQGTEVRFILPDRQSEAQIAIVTLTYPDHETALQKSELLIGLERYFQKTMVLTRFAYAVPDETLVIIFTENAGDDRIVRFIDNFAEKLKNPMDKAG